MSSVIDAWRATPSTWQTVIFVGLLAVASVSRGLYLERKNRGQP
jgi:hypothetical protein